MTTSTRAFRRAAVALAVALVATTTADANAEDGSQHRLREGERAFAEGRFQEALDAFQSAYDASGMNAILYNIGMCQWELDRPADAVNTFRRYMAEAEELSDEDRRELEDVFEQLRPHHGDLDIVVSRHGATVSLDGDVVGRSPLDRPVAVAPGTHTIAASLSGFQHTELVRNVGAGETLRVGVRLVPEPHDDDGPPVVDSAPDVELEPEAPTRRRSPWWFWTGVGITAASAIAMTVTGALALGLEADYAESGQLDIDAYERGRSLAVATDALLGVTLGAGTVALIAIIVHALRGRRSARARAASSWLSDLRWEAAPW